MKAPYGAAGMKLELQRSLGAEFNKLKAHEQKCARWLQKLTNEILLYNVRGIVSAELKSRLARHWCTWVESQGKDKQVTRTDDDSGSASAKAKKKDEPYYTWALAKGVLSADLRNDEGSFKNHHLLLRGM